MEVLEVAPDARSGVRAAPSWVLGYPSSPAAGADLDVAASGVARKDGTSASLAGNSGPAGAAADAGDAEHMEMEPADSAWEGIVVVVVQHSTSANSAAAEMLARHTCDSDRDRTGRLRMPESSIEGYGT